MTRDICRLDNTPAPSCSTGAAFGGASSQRQIWLHSSADFNVTGASL